MRYFLLPLFLLPLMLHAQTDTSTDASTDSLADLSEVTLAAQDGNAEAQCYLGLVYAFGEQGVQRDDAQAAHWFKLSAEQGHPTAQYNLAIFYLKGWGVETDTVQARHWYDLAYAQDNTLPPLIVERPATNDAVLTIPERNAKKGKKSDKLDSKTNAKFAEALKKYRPRAEAGDAIAQYNLGVLYNEGAGTERNYHEAFKWFRLAADQGDADAQNNLGIMYYEGQGVGKNYTQAFHWYNLAAEQGHVAAQYNLGIMYEQGIGTSKDRAKAKQWFKRAADQGYKPAQQRMANL